MKTPTLSDTQLVLLNAAAQRETGSLLPVPKSVMAKPPELRKSLESLLGRKLVVEQEVTSLAETWRDEDGQRFGLTVTEQGRAAIGVRGEDPAGPNSRSLGQSSPAFGRPDADPGPGRGVKQAQLIEMLTRPDGVSIDEVSAATAWLPHSARAMLTGLRKRGFTITSEKAAGVRRYRGIAPEASQ